MSRAIAVHLVFHPSRLTQSGGIMALMKLVRVWNRSTVCRRSPAADPCCCALTDREPKGQAGATWRKGCLNGRAALVGSSMVPLRRAAAMLLMLAFAVFALQAAFQPVLAAHMTHAGQTVAIADQACAQLHAAGDKDSPDAAGTGCSDDPGSPLPHDCCIQLCTFVAVLPAMSSVEPSWEDDVPSSVWPHRFGRALDRILRPPRLFAAL